MLNISHLANLEQTLVFFLIAKIIESNPWQVQVTQVCWLQPTLSAVQILDYDLIKDLNSQQALSKIDSMNSLLKTLVSSLKIKFLTKRKKKAQGGNIINKPDLTDRKRQAGQRGEGRWRREKLPYLETIRNVHRKQKLLMLYFQQFCYKSKIFAMTENWYFTR